MPDTETVSPAPGQVSDAPAPSSEELGGDTAATPEAETNGQANGDQKPESAGQKQKRESQFQRVKRQKAEYQKRESEFRAQQTALARERAEFEKSKKPKDEYTLADLKKFRPMWAQEAQEAQWDPAKQQLVEKADQEIARLEQLEQQEKGQMSFVNEWRQAEADLSQADPEFGAGKGTRLDKKLGEIMGGPDGNIYRQHPRGIVAAYHRARMEILEGDHQIALGKIQQLETELKRLTGLTSIGGGAPGRISGGRIENLKDFSKLSSTDMLKHLKSQAGKGGMPWL